MWTVINENSITSNTRTFVVEERSKFMTFIYWKSFGECGLKMDKNKRLNYSLLLISWELIGWWTFYFSEGHFYRLQNEFVVYVYFQCFELCPVAPVLTWSSFFSDPLPVSDQWLIGVLWWWSVVSWLIITRWGRDFLFSTLSLSSWTDWICTHCFPLSPVTVPLKLETNKIMSYMEFMSS